MAVTRSQPELAKKGITAFADAEERFAGFGYGWECPFVAPLTQGAGVVAYQEGVVLAEIGLLDSADGDEVDGDIMCIEMFGEFFGGLDLVEKDEGDDGYVRFRRRRAAVLKNDAVGVVDDGVIDDGGVARIEYGDPGVVVFDNVVADRQRAVGDVDAAVVPGSGGL